MKISIDCRYIRNRPSGIGNYVQALMERLPALSPEDTYNPWIGPTSPRPLTSFPNVEETVVLAPPNSFPTLAWPARLADLSRSDVFHAPFNLLGRGIHCATVVTIHDLIWLKTPAMAEGWSIALPYQALFYRNGILRALRRANRIIAASESTADTILKFFPGIRTRLRVIPHGVEKRFCPPEDPAFSRKIAALRIDFDGPYFLVIGQNAPFKNHRMILEAFAAANLSPGVRLVFVQRLYSDGGLIRRARRLGIGDRVIFLDRIGEEDLVSLLQSALALIQFSLAEGFGMPALEAIACGTPVIASDIPPLVEILDGSGLHVPLDPASLAAALRRLSSSAPLREELSVKGLERARAFSWDRSAALHLEVYREAAGCAGD